MSLIKYRVAFLHRYFQLHFFIFCTYSPFILFFHSSFLLNLNARSTSFKMQKVSSAKKSWIYFLLRDWKCIRIHFRRKMKYRSERYSSYNARFLHSDWANRYGKRIHRKRDPLANVVARCRKINFLSFSKAYHAHAIVQLNTETSVRWCPGNTGTVTPNVP